MSAADDMVNVFRVEITDDRYPGSMSCSTHSSGQRRPR